MKTLFSHDELSLSYIIFSRKKEKGSQEVYTWAFLGRTL